MSYLQYEFQTRNEVERSWLISILSDFQFEGFEETSDSLNAFLPANQEQATEIRSVLIENELQHIPFSIIRLDDKNWNEEWEKNFEPVIIANRVAIRAPFHGEINSEFEIIIEPKMSFGTGHHATTASVVTLMLKEDFENKTVLDFGSGTGILAILAEKLNAKNCVAIDNEEWAFNNCKENVEKNNCRIIEPVLGDHTFVFRQKFDIILANINRNVILENIDEWKKLMHQNSVLIVSGILQNDERDILASAYSNNLKSKEVLQTNGWLAIAFEPF